jgi:hypothetical protein
MLVELKTAPRPAALRPSAERKASVILYGNCQATGLRKILARMPYLSSRVNFRVIEYFNMRGRGGGLSQFPRNLFDEVDVVWEQLGTDFVAERKQFHCLIAKRNPRIIRFPAFTINTLWPFMGADKRLIRDPDYPRQRRYRIPDQIGFTVAQEIGSRSASDEEVFDRYMELSAERFPDLDRRLEIDHAQWRFRDSQADIAVFDYVNDNFRSHRLFHDPAHVSALPQRFVLSRLIEETLSEWVDCRRAIDELAAILADYHGMEWASVPIHPLVGERLRLSYYDPNARYLWYSHEWNFRDYIVSYIRWVPYVWTF